MKNYCIFIKTQISKNNILEENMQLNKFIKINICFLLTLTSISLASCKKPQEQQVNSSLTRSESITNIVVMSIENYKPIVIQLYPDYAPETVKNFQKLVVQGFYKNLSFFRSIKDFVVQAGDPNNNGTGGPGWTIKGEFKENGFDNPIHHTRGIVSMGRLASDNDSAGSQFFIVLSEDSSESLDGNYAAFGMVIDGMETVDAIAELETKEDIITNKPKIVDVYFANLPSSN